jgi:hydroxymethylbilane synthase
VLPREDARDAVVLPADGGTLSFEELVSRLGANAAHRHQQRQATAQLARLFPGATFLPIRGNLGTRLRKLDEGQYDAIVLASAGLIRLEHRARISTVLPATACIPAPGQGIIAIEVRADDPRAAWSGRGHRRCAGESRTRSGTCSRHQTGRRLSNAHRCARGNCQ